MAAASGAGRLSKSAVDWAKFAQKVPKDDITSFHAFKNLSERYVARVQSLPEQLPSLDFAGYKTRAGAKAAIVGKFETEYKALAAKIPYPKAEQTLKEIDAQEAAEKTATDNWVKESSGRVDDLNKKLSWWDTIPPLEQLSEQEWMYYFPGSYHDYKKQGHFADIFGYDPDKAQYQMNYRVETWKHPDMDSPDTGH